MNRRLCLSVVAVAVCFVVAITYKVAVPVEKPLEFSSVQEARERIERAGFNCVSFHEHTSPSLVISDKQITIGDAIDFYASHLANKDDGMVLVVTNRNAATDSSSSSRVWGKVLAFGDSRILKLVESKIN